MKISKIILTAATALVALVGDVTCAAEFTRLCDLEDARDMQCTIALSGEIRTGDAQKLRAVLKSDKNRLGGDRFLLLESPGGDVGEALRIAEVVKAAMLTTTLVRMADLDREQDIRRRCVSACFLILLAGAERTVMWGTVGVHRPYFKQDVYQNKRPQDLAQAQQAIEETVRRYARLHGASDQIIAQMMSRSSLDTYWLSPNENSALEGRQSWFEETMIASCKFDPRREAALYASGLPVKDWKEEDRIWLRRAYSCINARISAAQKSLTK